MSTNRVIDLTCSTSSSTSSSRDTDSMVAANTAEVEHVDTRPSGTNAFGQVIDLIREGKQLAAMCPAPSLVLDRKTGKVNSKMVICKRLSCGNPDCREAIINGKIALYKWAFKQEGGVYYGPMDPKKWKAYKVAQLRNEEGTNSVAWATVKNDTLIVFSNRPFEGARFGKAEQAKDALEAVLNLLPPGTKPKYLGKWSQAAVKEARKESRQAEKANEVQEPKPVGRYVHLKINKRITWDAALQIASRCGLKVTNRAIPIKDDEEVGYFPFYKDEQAIANLKSCLKRGVMPSWGLVAA